jgi:hypothetical protein
VEVNCGAGVVDVDANEIAMRIVIKHHPLGDLPALDAGLLRQIDVEGIRIRIVVQFHGLNRRSGKALWTVTLSWSVTILKNRPSNSSYRRPEPVTIAFLRLTWRPTVKMIEKHLKQRTHDGERW